MTEHVCEWEITPQKGNFLEVAKCKICGGVIGATFVEMALNEYETLKNATERLEETNKGLFNIIKAYHPEYIDGCECPQCGDMPIYFDDIREGK